MLVLPMLKNKQRNPQELRIKSSLNKNQSIADISSIDVVVTNVTAAAVP